MSLMGRVRLAGGERDVAHDRWTRLRSQLREGLIERLGYARIAAIADGEDAERARRELTIALGAILNDAQFAGLSDADGKRLATEVVDDIVGLGPLEPYLADDSVSEVMVNGCNELYFERAGRLTRAPRAFETEEQIRNAIDRILAPLGRRVDEQSPLANARLKNGYRVNAVIPPVAVDGSALTIRKFSTSIATLDELVELGSLPAWYAWLLGLAVRSRQDIAVVGGTGSGKTTLLNALSTQIDPGERVITIEDSAELKLAPSAHVVRLEARDASIEGTGAVTIRQLVINALRMRPDRIVVGEVRGAEAIDMLQAMNTGHDGSLTTLHAGSADEAVLRLVLMARYGMDLPTPVIKAQIATALDLIVVTGRLPDGSRVVQDLCRVSPRGEDDVRIEQLVRFEAASRSWRLVDTPGFIGDAVVAGLVDEGEVRRWERLWQEPVAC